MDLQQIQMYQQLLEMEYAFSFYSQQRPENQQVFCSNCTESLVLMQELLTISEKSVDAMQAAISAMEEVHLRCDAYYKQRLFLEIDGEKRWQAIALKGHTAIGNFIALAFKEHCLS